MDLFQPVDLQLPPDIAVPCETKWTNLGVGLPGSVTLDEDAAQNDSICLDLNGISTKRSLLGNSLWGLFMAKKPQMVV